jgi:phage tail-like protein
MPAARKNPLGGFLFGFKITSGPLQMDSGQGTAFFRQISGLKSETEIQDFNEGGNTAFTRKLAGVCKWPNLVLRQGFTGDLRLFKWKFAPERVNGVIIQLGPDLKEICRWEFVKGYPVKWDGPDLDGSKNEIAIESLEIAHEGLTFKTGSPAAEPPPPPPKKEPPPEPIDCTVNFAVSSSKVSKPNEKLDKASEDLKKNPERKVKIEADTDSTGAATMNKKLSQDRANAVKQHLLEGGTKESQIVSCVGYGKDRAVAAIGDNKNDASWRRTKVIDA